MMTINLPTSQFRQRSFPIILLVLLFVHLPFSKSDGINNNSILPHQSETASVVATRGMVGGYSNLADLQSEELLAISAFALNQYARKTEASSSESIVVSVSPEEVERRDVRTAVLEAQRQVVAGLNYKLTLAIFGRGGVCRGAIKVTVWNHFGDLSVTNWGTTLGCEQVREQFGSQVVDLSGIQSWEEEESALRMEEELVNEKDQVEPDE